jgi:hypothetical protein
MRIKMSDIIDARQTVLNNHQLHRDIREVKLLPMQEEAPYLMNSSNATAHDYPVTLATVKYEQYGPLILEVPDPPELEALREKVKELEKVKSEALKLSLELKELIAAHNLNQLARIASLEKTMDGICIAVFDNRGKAVTEATVALVRAAVARFELPLDFKQKEQPCLLK